MRFKDLKRFVEEMEDENISEDTPVFIAYQPRYPMQVMTVKPIYDESTKNIYIPQHSGASNMYIPSSALISMGWREEEEDTDDEECTSRRSPKIL